MVREEERGTSKSGDTETLPPLTTNETIMVPELVPGFTVLCHPDPNRIGEVCRLPTLARRAAVELSRTTPLFGPFDGEPLAPLDDPYLSRKPLTLTRRSNGSLELGGALEATALYLDGERLRSPLLLSAERLDEGVVLDLVHRVVLLLHWLGPPGEAQPSLGLIGENHRMRKLRENVLQVAQTDVPVLLSGESGTGKELVAAAIHRASPRADGPYFAINMAAVPPSMAASELFGHVKGAFTGAVTSSEGYFARADGGTLFLDEVGDTPQEVQVLLLRVLETGEIQPVGARNLRQVDVRLVAATDSDLAAAVQAGELRLSFLQRLTGFHIEIPPLRARREDIGRLLVSFLREELEMVGAPERLAPPVTPEVRPWLSASVVARLARYHWPGNVRQLRNVARQLVITSHREPTMVIDEAVERALEIAAVEGERSSPPAGPTALGDRQRDSDAGFEPSEERYGGAEAKRAPGELDEAMLREALEASGWSPSAAARRLGIGRTTMYKLLARSPNIRVASDLSEEEIRDAWERHGGDVEAMSRALEVSARALGIRLTRLGLMPKK